MNATTAFDRTVILTLRHSPDIGRPIGPDWLVEAFRDVTSLGSVTVAISFAVAVSGYWQFSGNVRAATLLLASAIGSLLLNDLLKFVFDRPRPDAVLQAAHVFSSGFPSGHATLSFTVYFSAAILVGRRTKSNNARIWLFCAAALVVGAIGFSRIYLGVHYPTDVLAGWCVGGVWVLSCNWLVGAAAPHLNHG